jgi:hypothetical protein
VFFEELRQSLIGITELFALPCKQSVSKGNQEGASLSKRMPAALNRILGCEPRKPNLIDRDPRPYKFFLRMYGFHCDEQII